MAEKRLSNFTGSVSGTNWSPAIMAAYNALQTDGGGRLYFDVPLAKMETPITMNTHGDYPLHIDGDGASRIQFANSAATLWTISGFQDFRMRHLVVHGDDTSGTGATVDCANGFAFGSMLNMLIDDVKMCGIRSTGWAMKITSGNVFKVKDSDFSGNGGGTLQIQGVDHIDIDNLAFIDYLTLYGFRTKVGDGAGFLQISNPPAGVVGARRTKVSLRNLRFDEASAEGIHIEDYQHVLIDQPRINVGSYGYAIGIYLKNIEHTIIRQPHVGYNNADRPIVKAEGCGVVDTIGCGRDANPSSPYRLARDGGSAIKNIQPKIGGGIQVIPF